MDPLLDHMVKDQDDSALRLIRGKEFLQLTKEEDFQGYALIAKPKEEVRNSEPLPAEVGELLRQYPSLVVEEKPEALTLVRSISH